MLLQVRSSEKSRARRPGARHGVSPRRHHLLEQLEEIFLAEGFRRVSVGELASRLRCSRRTLYELAPTKEALFLTVLNRLLERIRETDRENARALRDPGESIAAAFEAGVRELRTASSRFMEDVRSLPPAKRLLERHQKMRLAAGREVIQQGIRRRRFRRVDSRLAAEATLAAVQRVMEPEFLADSSLSLSQAIEQVEDLILNGLLHPDNARPRRKG